MVNYYTVGGPGAGCLQYGSAQGPPMAYMDGQPDAYGTFLQGPAQAKAAPAFVRGQRRRMNIVAIAMSHFVPWILFSTLFGVMSFSTHYQQPLVCYSFVGGGLLVVLISGYLGVDAMRQKAMGNPANGPREPSWYVFICFASLLAWVLAVVLGDINFYNNMQPFYDVLNLNTYPSVDPSRMRGQQLMDAGRIVFVNEAKLDISKSMGFKNLDHYCVAPITISNANASHVDLASYDFWAVGTNCCSGSSNDFHCGEFNNPRAHAGLRLMRDDQRAFFRLAVQQAEAAYSIKAVHPLFLYWMQDPIAEVNAYQDDGFRYYLIGMFAHFVLQLFLVLCAVLAFSKMGSL